MNAPTPRVFVSHSSEDKQMVRRIVDELKRHNVRVWFDEREMGVGDSIVQGISEGLKTARYLLVILSRNSVQSPWVQNELNAALALENSREGIVVLPAVIDDCEIPVLLKDRLYADFRTGFDSGVNSLLRVFEQEAETAQTSEPAHKQALVASDCKSQLSSLKLAELRHLMTSRMNRAQVAALWFDLWEDPMDNDMPNRTLVECVIELLDRARKRNRLADLIDRLCADYIQYP